MATINDIVSFMQKGMTNNAIVQQLVTADYISQEKLFMMKADNYYNNHNDIENIDFRSYKCNGTTKTNENRSNQRISNNYLKLLVDQLVNYVIGNGITYKHPDQTFLDYLDKNLMYDFIETVSMWLEESRIKGKSYMHFYYDEAGVLNYAAIPSEQIIPIYKDEFKKELMQVMRYYTTLGIDENGKQVIRKRVEWWDDKEVKIFQEDDKGSFTSINVLPHWTYAIDTTPDIVEPHAWNRVPFIELRTGLRGISDLQDIKGYIDSMDLIISEFVNQIVDVREILIKVLGYSGSEASEILQAFRGTGIVKIDDASGDIDVLKTEIPVEARNAIIKVLNDKIFLLGKGVDTNPEKYGTAIAGIAIQMMYKPLDSKADITIERLKKALREFMWFITDDYNRLEGANINYEDIEVSFNKNTIEDMASIIESSIKLKGTVSDQTIWERIPGIDPTVEEERMGKQQAKELEEFNNQVMQNNNLQEGV